MGLFSQFPVQIELIARVKKHNWFLDNDFVSCNFTVSYVSILSDVRQKSVLQVVHQKVGTLDVCSIPLFPFYERSLRFCTFSKFIRPMITAATFFSSELCQLGGGADVSKVKLPFLLISMFLFLVLALSGILQLLNWFLDFSERYFGLNIIVKSVFLFGKEGWNLLFHYLPHRNSWWCLCLYPFSVT